MTADEVVWAPAPAGLRPGARGSMRRLSVGAFKRGVDIAGAGLGLLVLSPLFASVALAVRFGPEGGRVFYGHPRIGRDGRTFRCWKFRTMVENGDEVLRRHLARETRQARLEWETTFKLKDDPRVTRLGVVMRKLSIDELPQLMNVVRGDMSLVGPRPVVAAELDQYGRSVAHYLQGAAGPHGAVAGQRAQRRRLPPSRRARPLVRGARLFPDRRRDPRAHGARRVLRARLLLRCGP